VPIDATCRPTSDQDVSVLEVPGYVQAWAFDYVDLVLLHGAREIQVRFDTEICHTSGLEGVGDRFLYRVVRRNGTISFDMRRLPDQENPHRDNAARAYQALLRVLDDGAEATG